MPRESNFQAVFTQLKALLEPCAPRLEVKAAEPALLEELSELTRWGFERFRATGWVS